MLKSWDSHSYEFLVGCLQEFKVLVTMLIELYRWIYECDEHMNGDESIILWPLMVLRMMNEFVMTYDVDLNDHNMHALMNDNACK